MLFTVAPSTDQLLTRGQNMLLPASLSPNHFIFVCLHVNLFLGPSAHSLHSLHPPSSPPPQLSCNAPSMFAIHPAPLTSNHLVCSETAQTAFTWTLEAQYWVLSQFWFRLYLRCSRNNTVLTTLIRQEAVTKCWFTCSITALGLLTIFPSRF